MSAKNLMKKYEVEINKHDFNLIAPLISNDCKFWFTSGAYLGLEQTRNAFLKTWNMINEEVYSISEMEWISESDNAAVCMYTYHWKDLIGGQLREENGRGTLCLRKKTDDWKIIQENLSNFPK